GVLARRGAFASQHPPPHPLTSPTVTSFYREGGHEGQWMRRRIARRWDSGRVAGVPVARHGFEAERDRVDAPALVRRHWVAFTLEDVPQMGVAAGAPDLGP